MNVLPLFKSHYSLRSILTLEAAGDTAKLAKENKRDPALGADSIFDLCLEENLPEVYLVEDGMSAFLEAYLNAKKVGLKFRFGYRVTVTNDMFDKSEPSLKTNSKVVIFLRNSAGYQRLIKISTLAATEGFYHEPRIDWTTLASLWNDDDLMLCIPFYDSFVYFNTLTFRSIVPRFPGKPVFFIEDNNLNFDDAIKLALDKFDPTGQYERQRVKSIYYRRREDLPAFMTYKCIRNRSTMAKPNLDHFASAEFCLEAWKEQNGR